MGYGTQMGLAVFNGQIYPVWAGNLNKGHIVNGAVQGPFLSIFYQPMVIADGPRVVSSDMGPISLAEAESGSVSFTVTFDRPINPPSVDGYTTTPTFTPADVLVYYHDTTNGDPSVPLQVTSVTPVAASGVGPESRFGYTQFQVTFNSLPSGANPATYNYTGTYSYMIQPDDRSGTAISSPIRSFVNRPSISLLSARFRRRTFLWPFLLQGRAGRAPAMTSRRRRSRSTIQTTSTQMLRESPSTSPSIIQEMVT